jgi:hypothetical protein
MATSLESPSCSLICARAQVAGICFLWCVLHLTFTFPLGMCQPRALQYGQTRHPADKRIATAVIVTDAKACVAQCSYVDLMLIYIALVTDTTHQPLELKPTT